MLFLLNTKQTKPQRLIPDDQKNEQYHIDYARWCVGKGSNRFTQDRIRRYLINTNFYADRQWITKEDIESFLMDETGEDRGRIKVTRNMIRPHIEQYRGNAERLSFDFEVYPLSPLARKRRDNALAKLLAYQHVADLMPAFGDHMRKNAIPIMGSEMETESAFDKLYTDEYVISVNHFAKAVFKHSKISNLKGQLAMDIALGGMAIVQPYIHGGDYRFKRVLPTQFGFDTSATDPQLKDAEYYYTVDFLSPATIFELVPDLDPEVCKAIEEVVSNQTHQSYATDVAYDVGGKIPVFTAYWRDITADDYGYIRDEFNQVVMKRINYIEPDEEKPQYTKKDVIPYNELNSYQRSVIDSQRKGNVTTLYGDLWRYCKFIPDEALSKSYKAKSKRDTPLKFGMVRYQEQDLYRSTNIMNPPFIVGMWSYLNGEVLSPTDVLISPQRMINRFLSVMEHQLSNSGLAGTIYDKDLAGIDEANLIKGVKRGEPVGIHAKGRGIQNAIGKYDASNVQVAAAYSQLIENYRVGIEQVTGVNEGVKGQPSNPDQLVGIMQLMIQRGSLIQEPFYKALDDIYEGVFQNIVTSGRRFYIDNDTDLVDMVGDEGSQIIKLSKNIRNESMAVAVKRTIDHDQQRQLVDQTLLTWIQFQIIDQETFAKLTGRANMNEALAALKEYHKRLAEQRRLAEQQQEVMGDQQQQQEAEMIGASRQEQLRQESREDENRGADRAAPIVREALKHTLKQ